LIAYILYQPLDKVFYTGTPASSTTRTDRHDIAEILLKVALKQPQKKSNNQPEEHKEKKNKTKKTLGYIHDVNQSSTNKHFYSMM
jgi:hypothetical protein